VLDRLLREGTVVARSNGEATRFANCGLQVLDAAGLADVIEFHDEGSETALPRFLAEGRTFDLAFVDGNHRFDGVFLDLVYLGRLVRPGGIVVADDCQLPSVRRAVSFCATNLDWTIEETSTANAAQHWVVLRTPSAARHRNFDDHVTFSQADVRHRIAMAAAAGGPSVLACPALAALPCDE
jgi:methyltransferase family protein